MRIGFVLWVVVAVIWIVLAVLSNEPEMRWGFTVAAALAMVVSVPVDKAAEVPVEK